MPAGPLARGAVARAPGGVSTASRLKLASLSSADGYAIYGINAGAVTRLTPTGGAWPYKPPAPARDVVPQPDGSVLVVGERGGATTVWHVRPPDAKVIDSATLARTRRRQSRRRSPRPAGPSPARMQAPETQQPRRSPRLH